MREFACRLRLRSQRSIWRWSRPTAVDALHDIYVEFFAEAPSRLESGESFEKFSTLCIDRVTQRHWRRRKQESKMSESLGRVDDGDHSHSSVLEAVFSNEWDELIDGALQQLPELNRRIFVAFHVEGLSVAEISEKVERSENTVRTYLKRTLETLQNKLRKSGFACSLAGLSMLFACSAYGEPGQLRLERLIDSASAIADAYSFDPKHWEQSWADYLAATVAPADGDGEADEEATATA